ncbi:MAG: PKD domain-containing protein [candidate division Zixibacteria bacterium]|nr:PKD domain-containing protein [candidate division Zixibacteria bacterium]MDH3938036.1 PKD domain-containing protein [candidate division Zixibacteria bacterium]MDH4033872.1 PKD domain-containing protein [candidate division Zixibacteria bacterium]
MISLRKLLPLLALTICLGGLYLPGCDTLVTEVNNFEIAGHPTAEFGIDSLSVDSGCTPLTVGFVDKSIGPRQSWLWKFGDGDSSLDTNPVHIYTTAGTYTVSLTILDSTVDEEPGADIEIKNRFIIVGTTADSFSVDAATGCPGQEITFTPIDYGGITSYSWNFGDGSNAVGDSNPTHIYDSVGSFACTLTVTGGCGTKVVGYDSLITIDACPVALIAANKLEGCAPCTVLFADTSDYRGAAKDSAYWQIGEDSSNQEFFEWVFDTAGIYTVSLSVWSEGGADDTTEVDLIKVWGPPEVTIVALGQTEGCLDDNWLFYVPFEATIPAHADTSAYDSLIWVFGDGKRSNPNDPLPFKVNHAYTNAGVYSVTIATYGSCYEDGNEALINTVVDYVCVSWPYESDLAGFIVGPDADTAAGIQGDTSVVFTFTDTTPGNMLGWNWTFGDGQSALGQVVTHQYADSGTYTTTLVVGNCCQSDTIEQTIVIDTMDTGGAFRRHRDPSANR